MENLWISTENLADTRKICVWLYVIFFEVRDLQNGISLSQLPWIFIHICISYAINKFLLTLLACLIASVVLALVNFVVNVVTGTVISRFKADEFHRLENIITIAYISVFFYIKTNKFIYGLLF